MGMDISYPVGNASLFAGAAREKPVHTCGWCLESGVGTLVYAGGRLVLESHAGCMVASNGVCSCTDPLHAGDDPNCSIHGGSNGNA